MTTAALALAIGACAAPYQGEKRGGAELTPYPAVSQNDLDEAHKPRRIALLVGIDRFDDPQWRPLRYAGRDARDMGAALLAPEVGGFDQVIVLTDPEDTGKRGLLKAFDDLSKRVGGVQDTVFVYLSTHGTLARDERGRLRSYLVAQDTKMRHVSTTGITLDAVRRRFGELRSTRKALVLATCHSGQGKSTLPPDLRQELAGIKGGAFFVPPLAAVSEASVVLSASSWGETAREDESLEHDIYTFFMLEALTKGLDTNGDGAVTVSEAHDHAKSRTYAFTAGRQRPQAVSDILGEDPIVLAGRRVRVGKPALLGYGEGWEGVRVRVGGTEKGGLPGSIVLDPGEHQVSLIRDGADQPFASGEIDLAPGQRVDLRSLLDVGRGDGLEFGVAIGGQGFVAADARAEVFTPGPLFRIEAAWPGALGPAWTLAGDVGFGNHTSVLSPGGAPLRAEHTAVVGGVGIYRDWLFGGLGGLQLRAGPRLEALSLERKLSGDDGFRDTEGVFSFGLGGGAGLGFPLVAGFSAVIDARLSFVYLRVDDEARNLTNTAAFGGVRYRL